MRYCLIFALLILTGCTSDQPNDTRIFLGQTMAQARQIAQSNGHTLYDASGLAMAPTPNGFYTAVDSDKDLLVLQDESGKVVAITIITNPAKPKSERTCREVEEFELAAGGG